MLLLFLPLLLLSCREGDTPEQRDSFYSKSGLRLVITPIKHASLQMTFNGKEYEIDPVSSYVRPIVDYTDKPKADFIIITNDLHDHFDPYAVSVLTKNTTNILLTSRCFGKVSKTALRPRCVVMRNNFEGQLDDKVYIKSVAAYDTTAHKRHIAPKTRGNGYVIDFDGIRVYIAGKTELIPEMKKLGRIDIAFLPCDYVQAMDLKQFREAVRIIRPRVLYPYQYGATNQDSIIEAARCKGVEVRMRALK